MNDPNFQQTIVKVAPCPYCGQLPHMTAMGIVNCMKARILTLENELKNAHLACAEAIKDANILRNLRQQTRESIQKYGQHCGKCSTFHRPNESHKQEFHNP